MDNSKSVKINKVKYNESEDKIFVAYTHSADGKTDIRTSKSNDKAAPEFYTALNALRIHAGNISGFTEQQINMLVPHTVTYSYTKNDIMGAIISCKYSTPNAKVININTPLMYCPEDEVDAQSPGYFSEATVKALWEVELQTRKYLDGKRAEMSLFDDENNDEKANDNDEDGAEEDEIDEDEEIYSPDENEPQNASQRNVVDFPGNTAVAG